MPNTGFNLSELLGIMNSFVMLGVGAMVGAGILYLILRFLVPSYLAEKGKNLATREDIAGITNEIEKVRTQYAIQLQQLAHESSSLIEEFKGRSQLRMAAAEKRLEAHQEAYTLWNGLIGRLHSADLRDHISECYTWWVNNCLYLSPSAREAFSDAYLAANIHESFKLDKSKPDLVNTNFDRIKVAGEKIVAGAELPALGEKEWMMVIDKNPNKPIKADA